MDNTTVRGGVTFIDLLQLVFIVLKLTKVIDWSWWIVLSPLWGTLLLVIVIVLIVGIVSTRK